MRIEIDSGERTGSRLRDAAARAWSGVSAAASSVLEKGAKIMAKEKGQQPQERREAGQGQEQQKGMTREEPQGQLRRREPYGALFGASPFSFMRRFSEEMDRLFEDFGFGPALSLGRGLLGRELMPSPAAEMAFVPDVEIQQREDKI